MAVPKTTQTRYMDGSVQRTTQVTPSLHLFFIFVFCTKMFPVISQQSLDTRSFQKNAFFAVLQYHTGGCPSLIKHQHLPPRTEKYGWLARLSMFLGIILGSEA